MTGISRDLERCGKIGWQILANKILFESLQQNHNVAGFLTKAIQNFKKTKGKTND